MDRPLNLIPVGLKEAALDSPTFRATTAHYSEQIELVERWLEGYLKAALKLVAEVSTLEGIVNTYLSQTTPPSTISEAMIDHDYTMLALRRYNEGAREFWQYTLRGVRRYDTTVIDPIRQFMSNELRSIKDAKRNLESCQRAFDRLVSQYASQGKTKEASSLREDAFQLYEGRRAYLKAAMDFCTLAPQVRTTLDKLLVAVFAEQWKEMRSARETNAALFVKWGSEMDRVRGWSKEMVDSEKAFQRELQMARKQIEENAVQLWRPSRELEDYNVSASTFIASGTSNTKAVGKSGRETLEKQGWLFQKTSSGKPARTTWSRRWFFVRNGIFGWLINGVRGGVEESEKIGVLLCSVRPAAQEERRFCFEVKTKDSSIVLQAETQTELSDWITAFEMVKRKALENPASTEVQAVGSALDPAFAVSPPIAPEFAVKTDDRHRDDDLSALAVPPSPADPTHRAGPDVTTMRKTSGNEKEAESQSSRLMSKLDLHKRAAPAPPAGGIASLIAASHNVLPVSPGVVVPPPTVGEPPKRTFTLPSSSLAPSTLANPPSMTNLSQTAVMVSSERGLPRSRAGGTDLPSAFVANLWGSSNWGHINRIGDDLVIGSRSPALRATEVSASPAADDSLRLTHRKTLSGTADAAAAIAAAKHEFDDEEHYPGNYPAALKAHNAQFRLLFPSVPRQEKVVLVFRATWNPNELQEFPGRVYVTLREVYFYSHHLGFVLITGAHLLNITDVTSAPGRDSDFVFLHLRESYRPDAPKRITVKTFLEPLKLLRRRLNYLVHNASSEQPDGVELAVKTLLKMETEPARRTSSIDSWEDVNYSPVEEGAGDSTADLSRRDMKASLRIDGSLYGESIARTGKEIQKFRLPAQPVRYAPQGMQNVVSRDFQVSAKALFHVVFGDKSTLFQLLYCNRWGDSIEQSPWVKGEDGHFTRRFTSKDKTIQSEDIQKIDVTTDHLCYVVTNVKHPWRLPYPNRLELITKMVITHSAKSRCKLAIYQQVRWTRNLPPAFVRRLIEKEALNALEADALDLTNVAMDQCARLGSHSKTNKAVEVFGNIGQHKVTVGIEAATVGNIAPKALLKSKKVKVTLFGLLVDAALNGTADGFSFVFNQLLGAVKAVLNLCTAHSLLVLILIGSAMFNTWHGYKDGMLWYHERNAGKYMARLGVTPSTSMARAVYLQDIEDMIAPPIQLYNATSLAGPSWSNLRTCQTTFAEHLSDVPKRPTGTAKRLHRTRNALSQYRHDLLAALRMVNRVEKDVVQGEWHNWARLEYDRCLRVERHLQHDRRGEAEHDGIARGLAVLGESFDVYCQSCKTVVDAADNSTALI